MNKMMSITLKNGAGSLYAYHTVYRGVNPAKHLMKLYDSMSGREFSCLPTMCDGAFFTVIVPAMPAKMAFVPSYLVDKVDSDMRSDSMVRWPQVNECDLLTGYVLAGFKDKADWTALTMACPHYVGVSEKFNRIFEGSDPCAGLEADKVTMVIEWAGEAPEGINYRDVTEPLEDPSPVNSLASAMVAIERKAGVEFGYWVVYSKPY